MRGAELFPSLDLTVALVADHLWRHSPWADGVSPRPSILHWRTAAGAEVDFVVELPHRLLPVEVKASTRVTQGDARHLRTFIGDYPEARGALLLHGGAETYWLERGILAVPWHRVI